MTNPETEQNGPALDQAARELQAAQHDARVAFDCLAHTALRRSSQIWRAPGHDMRLNGV